MPVLADCLSILRNAKHSEKFQSLVALSLNVLLIPFFTAILRRHLHSNFGVMFCKKDYFNPVSFYSPK